MNGGFASTWWSTSSVTFLDALGTYQLLWVNNKLNKFELCNDNIDINIFKNSKIVKPTFLNVKFDELSDILNQQSKSNDAQGLILHCAKFIFRIYSDTYSLKLKTNPKFNTIQELNFWKYQNNLLTNGDVKNQTIAAFNFVAITLHRLLMHFTKFSTINSVKRFEKINLTDYDKIKHFKVLVHNIVKLQHLPMTVKELTIIDFNQVKHHLKYYTKPQEIYIMLMNFKSTNDICKMIKYYSHKNYKSFDIESNIHDFMA